MTRGRAKETTGDPLEDALCDHGRTGIVTNQPEGYDPNRPHAATNVCGRPRCRAVALAWVQRQTGEPGTYISDHDRKQP